MLYWIIQQQHLETGQIETEVFSEERTYARYLIYLTNNEAFIF